MGMGMIDTAVFYVEEAIRDLWGFFHFDSDE